jgi:hypothetical protein
MLIHDSGVAPGRTGGGGTPAQARYGSAYRWRRAQGAGGQVADRDAGRAGYPVHQAGPVPYDRTADRVAARLSAEVEHLPEDLGRSLTHAPWQRDSNENTNGLLR